jgi:hypothetical protein
MLGKAEHTIVFGCKEITVGYDSELFTFDQNGIKIIRRFVVRNNEGEIVFYTDSSDNLRKLATVLNTIADFADHS